MSLQSNPYVAIFQATGRRALLEGTSDVGITIVNHRTQRARIRHRYSFTSSNEVTAIIPGDSPFQQKDRDIIVQYRSSSGNLMFKRISALHPAYWPLANPLLLPVLYQHKLISYHNHIMHNNRAQSDLAQA